MKINLPNQIIRIAGEVLCACGFFAGICVSTAAEVYYVDGQATLARDENSGSVEQPFKTIGRAMEAARAGDTVLIRPGVYGEAMIIRHSGTKAKPIVFQATKRHGVVIDGENKSTRGILLTGNDDIEYITVRGIVFRNAPYRGAWLKTGWRLEDCLVDHCGSPGNNTAVDARLKRSGKTTMERPGAWRPEQLEGRAHDITFLRVIVQHSPTNGMAFSAVDNILVKDCIIRRCNTSGQGVYSSTSASKIFRTDRCRVKNLVSYDNIGAGWWFDYLNTNFEVTGGTFFGNHGLKHQHQAGGIWVERNGRNDTRGIANIHSRIADNLIYSNHGAGLCLWANENLVVENNVLVDNAIGIWWRAMGLDKEGGHKLSVVLRNNVFKDWHDECHRHLVAHNETYGIENVVVDHNTYDPPDGRKRWVTNDGRLHGRSWREGEVLYSLDDIRRVLRLEKHGTVKQVPFDRQLIPTHKGLGFQVGTEGEQYSIDEALEQAGAKPGATVTIPAQGRIDIDKHNSGWQTEIHGLAKRRHVRVSMPTEAIKQDVEEKVSRWAMWEPVYLRVRIDKLEEYDIEATVMAVID